MGMSAWRDGREENNRGFELREKITAHFWQEVGGVKTVTVVREEREGRKRYHRKSAMFRSSRFCNSNHSQGLHKDFLF